MMIWHLALVAVLALGACLIWRHGWIGGMVVAGATYLFFQASSRHFLNPYYKDGGNGVWLSDGLIWMIWATVATVAVGGLVKAVRTMLARKG